jgi:uncharacterized protein (DUF1778 family)
MYVIYTSIDSVRSEPAMPTAPEGRRLVSFRLPETAIAMIDRAASLRHQDRTAFVLEAATRAAQDALLDRTLFGLTEAEHELFLAALDRPPQPNAALVDLARRRPIWER